MVKLFPFDVYGPEKTLGIPTLNPPRKNSSRVPRWHPADYRSGRPIDEETSKKHHTLTTATYCDDSSGLLGKLSKQGSVDTRLAVDVFLSS